MPELVSKKIMKIIKKHASLKGKVIEIHWKTVGFDGLEDCMHEQEKSSKTINNDVKIHRKIDETFMQKPCSKK